MAHAGQAGHLPASGDRQALILSGLLTGVYFVIELGVGLWSGSVAVISDAFHTFSAVGGVLLALVAQRLSERPATPEHTFGWGRAEIIGALFNGVFLVVMAGYVLWMGAMRLMEPIELPTTVMLYAAFGGIITELLYKQPLGGFHLQPQVRPAHPHRRVQHVRVDLAHAVREDAAERDADDAPVEQHDAGVLGVVAVGGGAGDQRHQ